MLTHTDVGTADYAQEYRLSDTTYGKYDSGFHAWLVERCESDDYTGDIDYGGIVLYGRFVDYWDSCGFHSRERFDTREAALGGFEEWSNAYYDGPGHEHETDCYVCGSSNHCGCICSLDENGNAHQVEEN